MGENLSNERVEVPERPAKPPRTDVSPEFQRAFREEVDEKTVLRHV